MPVIADFLAAHPKISIEAEITDRSADLLAERFDLAIRLGAPENSRLVARKIGERRRLLCAAPAYLAKHGTPTFPGDLADRDCLVFAGLRRWDMLAADGSHARVDVAGPFVCDDVEALLTAAEAGLGILLTTDWAAAGRLRDGRLVRVLEGWRLVDDGAIFIITPSGSHHASKTRAFADFLAARFRTMPWSDG